jgi:nucleoside-diphosphate-sugar epimerase
VSERDPDRPITIYDAHKLDAERLLESASAAGVVRGVTLRLANVYGPGAAPAAADRGVLNQMIRLAASGRNLTIFGDGSQLRDYTYVDDVALAFVQAAARAADISGRHFVLGSGERRTFAQIVDAVARRAGARAGREIAVRRVAPPVALDPIDARSYVVDASAFIAATGWRPAIDLDSGIDRTLDWIGATA